MNPEINILEDSKKRIRFRVRGEGHTLCKMLCKELWNDKDVRLSAYTISHPLIGVPEIIVETTGKEPRNALKNAVTRIKRTGGNFIKAFEKSLK